MHLHPQLENDTVFVADLALSRLLLNKDATYPWLLLVPRRADIIELIDLCAGDRHQLMHEISLVCTALKAETGCKKLNVAALGNAVPQLHVHVIARFETDPAWPRPIWGHGFPTAYPADTQNDFIARIRARLATAAAL